MRVYNFSAGPSTLPLDVLEQAQREFLDFSGTGMSVTEISHRSKPFEAIAAEGEALLRELLNISEDYAVLFVQGGASTQFAAVPLNLMHKGRADYVVTGNFAKKAFIISVTATRNDANTMSDRHVKAHAASFF